MVYACSCSFWSGLLLGNTEITSTISRFERAQNMALIKCWRLDQKQSPEMNERRRDLMIGEIPHLTSEHCWLARALSVKRLNMGVPGLAQSTETCPSPAHLLFLMTPDVSAIHSKNRWRESSRDCTESLV